MRYHLVLPFTLHKTNLCIHTYLLHTYICAYIRCGYSPYIILLCIYVHVQSKCSTSLYVLCSTHVIYIMIIMRINIYRNVGNNKKLCM